MGRWLVIVLMYGNAMSVLYCFIAALVESKLETGIIRHFLQVSVEKCVQECESNQHCKSVKYVRLSAFCTLYRVIQQESSNPGVYVYSKNLIQDCTNGQCWSEDKYDFCGDPVEIYGTKILGNMASVGSKIKKRMFRWFRNGFIGMFDKRELEFGWRNL